VTPEIGDIGGRAIGHSVRLEQGEGQHLPSVPPDVYKAEVVDIFKRLTKRWPATCPLKVINDNVFTALITVQKTEAGSGMKSP